MHMLLQKGGVGRIDSCSTLKTSKSVRSHYLDRTFYCTDVMIPPVYVWVAREHWFRHRSMDSYIQMTWSVSIDVAMRLQVGIQIFQCLGTWQILVRALGLWRFWFWDRRLFAFQLKSDNHFSNTFHLISRKRKSVTTFIFSPISLLAEFFSLFSWSNWNRTVIQ